jgi:uncharacterized protein YbjQ (UPF0145 family)
MPEYDHLSFEEFSMNLARRSAHIRAIAAVGIALMGLMWLASLAASAQSADQFITPPPSRAIPGRVSSTQPIPSDGTQLPGQMMAPTAAVVRPHVVPPAVHKGYSSPGFMVTTTSTLQNYQVVNYLGLVEGAAVRQPTWNEDASAGMQEAVGGSLDSYVQMCEEARSQAFTTLVSRAKEMGANAVVGVHFDSESCQIYKGKFSTNVVCVGTAVVVRQTK